MPLHAEDEMFLIRFLKGVLKFLAGVFAGRTGDVVEALKGDVQEIVARLMDSTLSGPERFEAALNTLQAIAAQKGIEAVDHALALLIEMEVTEQKGDALEDYLDEEVLGTVREVIQSVNAEDLVGDSERRNAALEQLKERFIAEGKDHLLSTHVLNLLIELAVSNIKR
jgi:hypothetical protein